MANFSDLENAVREYCARYHIWLFRISEPYDLYGSWQTTSFPYAESTGCYAFFDEAGTLLYIGKASCGSTIGRRADTYFEWRDDALQSSGSQHWKGRATTLRTIPVHEPHQAASL